MSSKTTYTCDICSGKIDHPFRNHIVKVITAGLPVYFTLTLNDRDLCEACLKIYGDEALVLMLNELQIR